MAIVRTAGTEIVRSAHFEDLNGGGDRNLIIGEQHHIYTVLSISIFCFTYHTAGDYVEIMLRGYDAHGGTTAQSNKIFRATVGSKETFVWNDKFSFNGHEPTDFTGPMDDATKQNAIADQGSSVSQKIQLSANNASSYYDVTVTFIDQNNS